MIAEVVLLSALAGSISAFEFDIKKILELTVPKNQFTQEQLSQMSLLGRIQARTWIFEYVALGSVIGYALLWALGAYWNRSKVNKWIKTHEEVLKDQFYQVGVSEGELVVEDNCESFAFYATGRLNIAQFHIRFTLEPRHNLFLYFMEVVLSFFFTSVVKPEDRIDIQVTLDKTASERLDQLIWAVVNKDNMNKYRELNYYLSLTRTSDSDKLPLQFVFMSEVPELNEVLYSSELDKAILASGKTLRYLAITDQPLEKPKTILETRPNKRLVLQLNFPSSASDVEGSKALLNSFIQFVDFAVKKEIKPETVKKVLKVRDNEIKKIQKVEQELKKEEEEYQRAEKRRALSEEQQKKLEKKKLKKLMRQQRIR